MELLINRVSKQFRNKIAVDNISLNLTPGVYGFWEPTEPKVTLMRMICGYFNTGQRDHYAGWKRSRRGRIQGNPGIFATGKSLGYYPEFTGMGFLMYLAALRKEYQRAQQKTAALGNDRTDRTERYGKKEDQNIFRRHDTQTGNRTL